MPGRPPLWALVLEAAGMDPLRAQVIEDQVSAEWWMRYVTYRRAEAQAAKHLVES